VGDLYLGIFTGVVICLLSVSLIAWLGEKPPATTKSEPMRHIDEYVY
jgi:hypothetical protein